MAVAFGSARSVTPATGSTVTSSSWAISGTNLLIVITIGIQTSSATVSSVSWSLGSGTAVLVNSAQTTLGISTNDVRTEIWAIPAPTSGSGTYTVNLSASSPYQVSADYFTGADQTTPCPVSDSMTVVVNSYSSGSFTFNPTNVGSSDGVYAAMSHGVAGDSNGWTTGTSDFEDKTTAVNTTCAHNTGASATCVAAALINSPATASVAGVGVRVQAPAGPPVGLPFYPPRMPLGV